jgi:hypothetical protein
VRRKGDKGGEGGRIGMRGGKEDMGWEMNRKGREEGSGREFFFWGGGGGMQVWRYNIK